MQHLASFSILALFALSHARAPPVFSGGGRSTGVALPGNQSVPSSALSESIFGPDTALVFIEHPVPNGNGPHSVGGMNYYWTRTALPSGGPRPPPVVLGKDDVASALNWAEKNNKWKTCDRSLALLNDSRTNSLIDSNGASVTRIYWQCPENEMCCAWECCFIPELQTDYKWLIPLIGVFVLVVLPMCLWAAAAAAFC